MSTILHSFAEKLEDASSQDECFTLMYDVATAIGFSAFAYDYTPVTRSHDGKVIPPNLLRTYNMPESFEDLWLNHGYYTIDVAWLACHSTTVPFVWICGECFTVPESGVRLESGPKYRQMFEYMNDMKLTIGINVPVHVPGGGLATVNALKFNPERRFLEDARHWVGEFTKCAYELQAAVTKHFDTAVLRSRHVHLSDREIECLRLSARGHTTEEIAEQIYRSVPTAALHLKNAAQKLGARNRAQAIARAAHYHLLDDAC